MNSVPYRLTPAMLHSIDADGRIVAVSELWLEKLGYERDEVIGKRSVDFLTPESHAYAKSVFVEFFQTGRCVNIAYDFVKKNGEILPVRLSGQAEYDEDGNFLQTYAVLHDVSELVAMEKRLLESQKLESLGMLSSGIAHDFNNLLVAILGNAEVAQLDAQLAPSTARGLQDIVGAAQQAAGLCRQLLAYSGKGRFLMRDVDLSTLVRDSVSILEVSLGEGTHLRYDLASPPPVVKADPSQLHQIVMNLVTNAADAMRGSGGLISVATANVVLDQAYIQQTEFADTKPGHFAAVIVSDEGDGMDASVREHMFDPFYTTKETGSGLGLAAVHGIVRSHSGTVHVYSEPGRGTTVKVYLPCSEAEARPSTPRARTVLVVDDDERVRCTAKRILEASGFEVMVADNGAEAIHRARTHAAAIDCLLLDVSMPGNDGPTAYDEILSFAPNMPVVFMSGYDHDGLLHSRRYTSNVAFLSKPFAMRELVETLESMFPPRYVMRAG